MKTEHKITNAVFLISSSLSDYDELEELLQEKKTTVYTGRIAREFKKSMDFFTKYMREICINMYKSDSKSYFAIENRIDSININEVVEGDSIEQKYLRLVLIKCSKAKSILESIENPSRSEYIFIKSLRRKLDTVSKVSNFRKAKVDEDYLNEKGKLITIIN